MLERFRRWRARRRAINRQMDETLRNCFGWIIKPSVLQVALMLKRQLREQDIEVSVDEMCRVILRHRWMRR